MDEAQVAQEQKRELCPNLTTSEDLVNRIGALSVDVLNKEKVLLGLWKSIDELTVNVKSLNEEVESLNNIKDSNENTLSTQGERIQVLESEKQSIEKSLREELRESINQRNTSIKEKNTEINRLNQELKTIESQSIINQEEIRKELMETRDELSILKQSLKPKKVKKKKTSTKPARA